MKGEFVGELGFPESYESLPACFYIIVASNCAQKTLVMPYDNGDDNFLADSQYIALAGAYRRWLLFKQTTKLPTFPNTQASPKASSTANNLNEIIEQAQTKKALEIAAAGSHNLLM